MSAGDHIRVNRGIYYHHGIEVENGAIIHFTGEVKSKFNAAVQKTHLYDFVLNGKIERITHLKCFPVEKTIQLTYENLGKTGYNLTFNNCEHFAVYCKTGEQRSRQIEYINYLKYNSLASSSFFAPYKLYYLTLANFWLIKYLRPY